MDATDIGAVANVDITLSSEDKSKNVDSVERKSKLVNDLLCEPCSTEINQVLASFFCKTCDDPEPMCDICANQHTRQKLSRNHKLCEDLEEFQKRNPTSKDMKKRGAKAPGKPKALRILSDMVVLFWTKSEDQVDYYQIRYKSKGGQEKWKFAITDEDQNQTTIFRLMSNTVYVFQVRGVFQDQEGNYGPASDDVETAESLTTYLLRSSINVASGNPPKYQLMAQELKPSRNSSVKTRKLILGNPEQGLEEEKTIMLVGVTGTGKSTLVDGIVNFVMGVSFDDPFRFTLVQLEEEEKKSHNQRKKNEKTKIKDLDECGWANPVRWWSVCDISLTWISVR